jgi:hypothetical protein
MRLHELRLDQRTPELPPRNRITFIPAHNAKAALRAAVREPLDVDPAFEYLASLIPAPNAEPVALAAGAVCDRGRGLAFDAERLEGLVDEADDEGGAEGGVESG